MASRKSVVFVSSKFADDQLFLSNYLYYSYQFVRRLSWVFYVNIVFSNACLLDFFSCPIALSRSVSTMLNKSDDEGILALILTSMRIHGKGND